MADFRAYVGSLIFMAISSLAHANQQCEPNKDFIEAIFDRAETPSIESSTSLIWYYDEDIFIDGSPTENIMLLAPFGVNPSRQLRVTSTKPETFYKKFDELLAELSKQNEGLKAVTISFVGHGIAGALSPTSRRNAVSHEDLLRNIFSKIDDHDLANKMIVNFLYDACYSGSMIPTLQSMSIENDRPKYLVNIITASNANQTAFSHRGGSTFFSAHLSRHVNAKIGEYTTAYENSEQSWPESGGARSAHTRPLQFLGADICFGEKAYNQTDNPNEAYQNQINIWSSYDETWTQSLSPAKWDIWKKYVQKHFKSPYDRLSASDLIHEYIDDDKAPFIEEAIPLFLQFRLKAIRDLTKAYGRHEISLQQYQSFLQESDDKLEKLISKNFAASENILRQMLSDFYNEKGMYHWFFEDERNGAMTRLILAALNSLPEISEETQIEVARIKNKETMPSTDQLEIMLPKFTHQASRKKIEKFIR